MPYDILRGVFCRIYGNSEYSQSVSTLTLWCSTSAPVLYVFTPILTSPSVVYAGCLCLYLLMHCSHLTAIVVYCACHINSWFTAVECHLDTSRVSYTP